MNLHKGKKANQQAGRLINRRLILNLVRTQAKLCRSEIASLTGLSVGAVSSVVGELLEEGYLDEGQPEGSGTGAGRKRVPLSLNTSKNHTVGLRLSTGRLDCLLSNFAMEVVARETVMLTSMSPEEVVDAAGMAVANLLAGNKTNSRILGAGLAAPGVLDPASGICIRDYRFDWENVPIGPMLSEALGLPVVIGNDTHAFALAHHLFGLGQSCQTFLAVAVGGGIGCAIVNQDMVFHGIHGGAGEIGHVLHDEDNGPICECGRKGCLQARYSVPALETAWHAEGNTDTLVHAVASGNEKAKALVSEAGKNIGRHLAEWVTMSDPEMIILGGEGVHYGAPFISAMQDELDYAYYRDQAPIIVPDESEFYWTAGAAAIAIQSIFKG